MFDTHTHVNDDTLFPEWQKHIADFINAWGTWLVNVAVNAEWALRAKHIADCIHDINTNKSSDTTVVLSQVLSDNFTIWATIGIHPSTVCFWEITRNTIENEIENIKNIFNQSPDTWRAIWECWIDLHYAWARETVQLQQELLAQQCQFSLDVWLPLVIHSRDGFQETIDILSNFANHNIATVFHCFGYGPKEAEYLLSHFKNVYFWFDWNITYPKAEPLRETLLLLPNNKVLLETDAPFLAPQWLRWQINTPTNVQTVYEYTAMLKKTSLWNRTKQINTNAERFYNISV